MKNKSIRLVFGLLFLVLFLALCICQLLDITIPGMDSLAAYSDLVMQFLTLVMVSISLFFLLPEKERKNSVVSRTKEEKKLPKRTLVSMLSVFVLIPLTILFGMFYLEDKQYYVISLLMIIEIMAPFFVAFEGKKPDARELVVISVLCALAVCGRMAFFMLPQFKPVAAIIIVAGVAFGAETGFLTGAVTGFVSNFFFGQGAWTPWQMFTYGLIGFLAGLLFTKGFLRQGRVALSVFGFLVTLVLHNLIMNPATVLMWQPDPTWEMFLLSCLDGLPFDLLHAFSTTFFLLFISEPVLEQLNRIKRKYGMGRVIKESSGGVS